MSFVTIFKNTFFFLVALFLLVSFAVFQMNISDHEEHVAIKHQEELRLLGEKLAAGSDYLTSEIRRYVQFGNKTHYDNFWREVNETRSRDKVVERLKELKVYPKELSFIEAAKGYSDNLIKTEELAMKAVENSDFQKARELVFGEYYDEQKSLIMGNIKSFQDVVNKRAAEETKRARTKAEYFSALTNGLLFLSGILILFLVYFVAIKRLVEPIKNLTSLMLKLAQGDVGINLPLVSPKNEIGEMISALAIFKVNMIKRKELESELQVLIKEKSMILDTSGDGIYGLDLNGHTIFANPAAEKLLGYSFEEMLNQSQHALIHHSKADGTPYARAECPIYAAFKDGLAHHIYDEVFWRKDGSSFPVEYIANPIVDDGEIKGAVVSFKDITDRIKAEETTSRLGRILDNSSNEIYTFDASTFRFSQANSGARENLGYSMEELAHMTPLNIKPEHTMETFEKLIKPLRLREKSVVLFETAHKRKNGTLYPVEVKVQLMHEETPPVFIAIIQDITVRKKAEEELQKHREHLEELVEERTVELTRANKQLREFDHLKSMFMASMSHELRTPLNSIIGFTSLVMEEMTGKINPKQKEYLGRAYQSSKHLLALITDVMDISKVESGTIEAAPELFNLDKVVTEALDNSSIQKMKSEGIELKIKVPLNLEIYSDRKRVLQCLINLLSNAAKFTESGSIRVTAREVEDDIEIMVEDTGIGVAEADLPKLFQQFERLDSPLKIKAGGTGLGLYLTQKLATEILGGSVSVESQLGVGSKFYLRFPKQLRPH